MTRLKPFIGYFGAKWRLAPRYPPPRFNTVVEPFAGSAGYSLLYPQRSIHLCDASQVIAGIWEYLVQASEEDILGLPDVPDDTLSQAQKDLIGFWYGKASVAPRKTLSPWAEKYPSSTWWGPKIRQRIASQLQQIRHWRVQCSSYEKLPDVEATWFIDPPYQHHGSRYPCGSKSIDYQRLSQWCRSRRGQVIVCEGSGADWLPFTPLTEGKRPTGKSSGLGPGEVVWTNE